MAYNRNQARALCNDAEYRLFEASLAENIGGHGPATLRSNVNRARRLRDKYRDLHQRQRLATRERTGTKKGNAPERNARTEQKARLFDEVLGRFARRSEKLASSGLEQKRQERRGRSGVATRSTGRSSKRRVQLRPAKRTR
jgi:hypothetical protein